MLQFEDLCIDSEKQSLWCLYRHHCWVVTVQPIGGGCGIRQATWGTYYAPLYGNEDDQV